MNGNPEMSPGFSPEQDKKLTPEQIRSFFKKHHEAILSSDPQRGDGADCASAVIIIMTNREGQMSRQEILDEERQVGRDEEMNEEEIEAKIKRYNDSIDGLIKNGVLIEENGELRFNMEE